MKYVYSIAAVIVGSLLEYWNPLLPGVGIAGGACYLIGRHYGRKELKDELQEETSQPWSGIGLPPTR